jgi:hypothetical protein
MDVSEKVEGYIDLETLDKIRSTLSNSTDQKDVDLAVWIQRNYLYEPIGETEDGRPISSREGFEKLDRAYKRVRSLTNRAQDKWPFFDRHWKKMPANTVRQVAQGFPAVHGMLCLFCPSTRVCKQRRNTTNSAYKALNKWKCN